MTRVGDSGTQALLSGPPELVGRCFNSLARDHVTAQCCSLMRCFRCRGNGHQARACKRSLSSPHVPSASVSRRPIEGGKVRRPTAPGEPNLSLGGRDASG
jgi:hypothetical protein